MGGKSRKSGGVSRELIERLKRGPKAETNKCRSSKKKEEEPKGGFFGKK